MLHIEHLEGVPGEVPEGLAVKVLVDYGFVVDPGRAVREDAHTAVLSNCILEAFFDRVVFVLIVDAGVAADLAVGEVDLAVDRGMDAAQIQQQDAVHVDPQVVVAGELVDNGVAVLQSVVGLHEGAVHGHAEEVVDRLQITSRRSIR